METTLTNEELAALLDMVVERMRADLGMTPNWKLERKLTLMKKRTLYVAILMLVTTFATKGQNLTCVSDCDRQAKKCREDASEIYITCGQQGGTEADCEKKRRAYLATCGCEICSSFTPDTPRTGLMKTWYCKCGEPRDEKVNCVLTYDGTCDVATPILIDVAGDGLKLTDVTAGVRFDIRATGSTIPTAWTTPSSDDAWLALDRNGNGTIDDGAELFGNVSPQPERLNKNGFLALAEFDKSDNGGNADGQITSQDAIFSSLKLWQDTNHNGTSEPIELIPLSAEGVESISLDYKETRRVDAHGNVFRFRSQINGSRSAWDVFLVHESTR